MFVHKIYFLKKREAMNYLYVSGCVVFWIFLSSSIILSNKYIIHNLKFPVVTLVTLHQITTLVFSESWCRLKKIERPKLTCTENLKSFFVVALLFATNLALSNAAYVYLNVALIQMIKAITPVFVLLSSFAFRLEKCTIKINTIILLITTGVCTSSINDGEFGSSHSTIGYTLQFMAILAEAVRLSIAKMLLSSYQIGSIPSLTLIGRNVVPILIFVWMFTDMIPLFESNFTLLQRVDLPILILNCSIAFFLNCASMMLIEATSPLTLNICGIVKDFLLVVWSVLISHSVINNIQYIGFAISTVGIIFYTIYKNHQSQPSSKSGEDESAKYALLQDDSDDDT